ncbi:MAG: hypothetical protein JWN18_240 [Parcubacteria group bacterium]|nr:hypothetical protein [Parcubacteria group bacterium]
MNSPDTFSQDIVRKIEARGVVPKPRWYFLASRSALWFLAIGSVVIGAIAFAIADFVFLDNDGISKLQGSSIQDVAEAIPFVWLAGLALFTVSAYYAFRHTRGGYKYRTATIVFVMVLLSIGLGLILNAYDFGQHIHAFILHITSPGAALPTGSEGMD